jgi:uncharacterized protein YjeT (DUF2065 family)
VTATSLAGAAVVLAGLYLLGFGALALLAPSLAARHLLGFASSLRLHALELALRMLAGLAFVGYADQVHFAGIFHAVGLVLVLTTLGLALLPWRWHQRVARSTVPATLPYLPWLGLVSLAAGGFVCWAVASAAVG